MKKYLITGIIIVSASVCFASSSFSGEQEEVLPPVVQEETQAKKSVAWWILLDNFDRRSKRKPNGKPKNVDSTAKTVQNE